MLNIRFMTREEFRDELLEDLKARIPFEAIGKFLPFQTRVVAGHNHNHIQTQSIFDVETERRTLRDGDTLCGRTSTFFFKGGIRESNCPGCEAIGKGLAVRDLV